jgi:hypothetical protein
MNFFYSIPSTYYIHITYYPKEKKKEKNIISHPCKEGRERERWGGRKKAGNLFSCPNGRYVVLSDSLLSLSKRLYAGVSIDNLVKTKKDK